MRCENQKNEGIKVNDDNNNDQSEQVNNGKLKYMITVSVSYRYNNWANFALEFKSKLSYG